jgi:hypothetical protein
MSMLSQKVAFFSPQVLIQLIITLYRGLDQQNPKIAQIMNINTIPLC